MNTIEVSNLSKKFQIADKQPGFAASIRSLWSRHYRQVDAVKSVSFSVEAGELVGFIGPNGAGKTTTLKCLSGLLYPSSGEARILGYTPWERKDEMKRQMALVMGQKQLLWWDLPAIETYKLHQVIYEIPDDQFKKTLDELTDLLGVREVLTTQVRNLSLGQRMKCELIAALLHQPKILFLDEPTIGLDVVMQKVMREFIREYNRSYGATILLTSHYMDDVKELCKRVIMIDQGQIMFDGSLSSVIDKYARYKILKLTFGDGVTKERLQTYGEIKTYESPEATLLVPRKEAAIFAAKILSELPITDITIEEPPIEAIIREVFSKEKIGIL